MNTITRNRWTPKEVRIAKEALKLTNGNQKKAAIILSSQLDRSVTSIQVRLCSLAKKHPSLRKKNIAKKAMKAAVTETPTTNVKTVKVKSVILDGDKMIITF